MDWIDEFIELFMSQKTGSVEKALLYKQQYIPQKLYRYRSAEKIERLKDEIVNGRIFMSSPLNMNDPFDSCSLLENNKPTVYVHDKEIYKERFNIKGIRILLIKSLKMIIGLKNLQSRLLRNMFHLKKLMKLRKKH